MWGPSVGLILFASKLGVHIKLVGSYNPVQVLEVHGLELENNISKVSKNRGERYPLLRAFSDDISTTVALLSWGTVSPTILLKC